MYIEQFGPANRRFLLSQACHYNTHCMWFALRSDGMILRFSMFALLVAMSLTVQAEDRKPVSFIQDVAPILKENCFACHNSKKSNGKYDMTTFEKLMAGGSGGEAVVPGKLDDSDLHALMVTKEDRRMPPREKGEAVPAEKAAIVAEWIQQGAKFDAGIDRKADLLKELRSRWKPPIPPTKYERPNIISALAFTPDGKSIVVGGHHELIVCNSTDGKLTRRIRTRAARTYAMVFLKDGTLAVAGSRPGHEGDLLIYDLSAKATIFENEVAILDGVNDPKVMLKQLLEVDDSVLCLSLSADGNRLAAGGCDRIVRVWDVSAGAAKSLLEQSIENHADWVLGVALSADGKKLLSSSRDKTAKVWDLTKKESILTFPDHQNTVYAVGISSDGTVGYSTGQDQRVRSWKPDGDGKQLKDGGGHTEEVFKLVLDPKSGSLATCSADETVRLWDTKTTTLKRTLSGLTDQVFAIAFSPDGSKVAGGSASGEVAVWQVQGKNDQPVAYFQATPGMKR
jgi:hypothetical protein